jgi:hypothetical protein
VIIVQILAYKLTTFGELGIDFFIINKKKGHLQTENAPMLCNNAECVN